MSERLSQAEDRRSTTPASAAAARRARGRLALCAGALAMLLLPHTSLAQGRLDAQYEATLAGIPVGKGGWTIDVGDDQYSASANGGTIGLLKAFAPGSGTSAAQGKVVKGALVGTSYFASTTTPKKSESVHITLVNGNVKEFSIQPQPPHEPERLPVSEAQRRGVSDPMTAALVRVPGTADPVGPEACHNSATVFDGRMRYEMKLDFKRMETVKAQKGYFGPVVVCAIYFKPIAGYIPSRPVIKYLAAERNMEIALAPLAGTRVLVPFRLVIPTPLGLAKLEATQFITQAMPPHVAKTQ